MGLIDRFVERAKQAAKRVVFPEAEDERIIQAAIRLVAEGISHPILLGSDACCEKSIPYEDRLWKRAEQCGYACFP